MKAVECKVSGFIVVNEMGQVYQDPLICGFSWIMPGHPGSPFKFTDTEEAQLVVDAYNRKARIRPIVDGFPIW